MLSFDEAIRIAKEFSEELESKYPGKIKAVYVIGSLGSNYYRPGQSDIDTAVITSFRREDIAPVIETIELIANRYQQKYDVPKGFGAIVFAEEMLFPPYIKEEELIQEILRLKTQGRLIFGQYDVDDIPMPDWNAVKADILNFQEWVDSEPPFEHDSTSFVNSTLIALKRYLLLKHHIIEFNKFLVIDLYMQNDPPIVNEEIFAFINDYIHGRTCEWNDGIRERFTKWHDELYKVVNGLVLYNS